MSSMVFGGWSVVFISYYPSYTSEKGNNDDLRQSDCGERLVWTLFVFIFVHILIHVSMLGWFMWGICHLRSLVVHDLSC
jgi:uncharacterized ion transporter superfamily protein YfcC